VKRGWILFALLIGLAQAGHGEESPFSSDNTNCPIILILTPLTKKDKTVAGRIKEVWRQPADLKLKKHQWIEVDMGPVPLEEPFTSDKIAVLIFAKAIKPGTLPVVDPQSIWSVQMVGPFVTPAGCKIPTIDDYASYLGVKRSP